MAKRLMCVTAHPDDESGAFGGTLMLAHARGVETSVLCLTAGTAGSHRGSARTDEELGQMRRQEFADALRVLQVDQGEVLDYPDGKLAQQNFAEVVAKVVERIRRFRPHIVLTFGGDGGVNRHPDHTMTSCFATAAFHWAARSNFAPDQLAAGLRPHEPQKLYYAATPFLFNANKEQTEEIALVPASLVLDLQALKEKKFQAFSQHKTQAAILSRVRDAFDRHAGVERYLLAATRGLRLSPLETDMFDGIGD